MFDRIVGAGTFDKKIDPPEITLRRLMVRHTINRLAQGQRAAAVVGGVFRFHMRSDADDVFHQLRHIFENVVVHALQDVAHAGAGLIIIRDKGVVDVTAAIALGIEQDAGQGKRSDDLAEVFEGWSYRSVCHDGLFL